MIAFTRLHLLPLFKSRSLALSLAPKMAHQRRCRSRCHLRSDSTSDPLKLQNKRKVLSSQMSTVARVRLKVLLFPFPTRRMKERDRGLVGIHHPHLILHHKQLEQKYSQELRAMNSVL
mmetsp:Transcript_29098/g.55914  ORF Transcript_29098/g.55914 Transcript_29098/m.55914 type:complete len:118 (+) Transcript_29098:884-1237(+)